MSIVAVTATCRRPRELARLLASLAGVDEIVVCDNAACAEVRGVVAGAPLRTHYLAPGENLGCGGGLRLAEQHAWQVAGATLTHLLVLDDDAVLAPDTVPGLVAALAREQASAAYPLVLAADGRTGWLPGLEQRAAHRLGKTPREAAEYRASLAAVDSAAGGRCPSFIWAQGICLLVARAALEQAGFHRDDFWVRGEDLDFSLRLTAQGRGIFVPEIAVRHLPPDAATTSRVAAEYLRHAAMVQNIAYLALTQPHGRRIRDSLPGTGLRFVRTWGLRALPDLCRALRRGSRGEPAGRGAGRTFRRRCDELD
jgi:GT2 family glycosyltransferase